MKGRREKERKKKRKEKKRKISSAVVLHCQIIGRFFLNSRVWMKARGASSVNFVPMPMRDYSLFVCWDNVLLL